ncbi:MAG: tail fiber domain-containing protein [Candidatus Paceibacterota bacterium]|jgi:hypothetical protein
MNTSLITRSIIFAGAFALCATLAPNLASAQTWTAPTLTPPGGNVSEPINASSSSQTKVGGLSLGSLNVTGNASAVGSMSAASFLYSSDRSLKENIQTFANPLATVLGLRGVSFTWKKGGQKDFGVIAQEVEKVIPEAVHINVGTGLKSVEYGNLVGVLIEAIKAQQVEIDALKARVDSLTK